MCKQGSVFTKPIFGVWSLLSVNVAMMDRNMYFLFFSCKNNVKICMVYICNTCDIVLVCVTCNFNCQLDSIAFFPYLSWGANNELASIATLMAILETIGRLKQNVSAPHDVFTSIIIVLQAFKLWCI